MQLIVQPDDGIAPLVRDIVRAKSSIDIVIFRFDIRELERALLDAVARGVKVRALVAHTANKGEKMLRDLEQRFADGGVEVVRTGTDLVRYHGKLLIIDRQWAFVLGFNYTHRDIKNSRSFGVRVADEAIVKELCRLVDADAADSRHQFVVQHRDLVASPENARAALTLFIQQAREELLIYDDNISDDRMIELLRGRAAGGLRVRIVGKLEKKWRGSWCEMVKLKTMRLHVRGIIRDRAAAFIGSQSLRRLELDERREVGIIVRDEKIVNQLASAFEADQAANREFNEAPEASAEAAPRLD
jgi:phosphatidylserine/phosphatidylglycerophosphate/cardiolipin synthase-like enzyme